MLMRPGSAPWKARREDCLLGRVHPLDGNRLCVTSLVGLVLGFSQAEQAPNSNALLSTPTLGASPV